MPRRNARLVALVAVALVAAIAACELATRWLRPQNLSGTWLVPAPAGPYLVNKSEGTARHQLDARIVRYSFFGPHLRGPAPLGRRRVLVLGDSFTFGVLLSDSDTIVSGLQRQADAAFGPGEMAFLNAGIGGSGTAEHVAFYEDFGLATGAETVVVLMNRLDITRSQVSRVFDFDPATNELSRRAPESGMSFKTLVNALPIYELLLERSHLLQLARRAALPRPARSSGRTAEVATIAKPDPQALGSALFRRLAALARGRGHRLVVVTTGWPMFAGTEPTQEFLTVAPALFNELGVPFAELLGRVAELSSGLTAADISIPVDLHPNERGARIIAEAAWEALAPSLR